MNYDKWIQWDLGRNCNLACEYCFDSKKIFNSAIKNIEIDRLLEVLRRSGYKYRIGLTGGEPFLVGNVHKFFVCAIKEGHVISVNTNLLYSRFEKFVREVDPVGVLFIHASFHYRELESRNLLQKYLDNFHLLEENGFNIYAESVFYPGDYELLLAAKEHLESENIKLRFAPYIGKYEGKWYPDHYSPEELEMFNINPDVVDWYSQKGETCNAGYSAAIVDPDGDIRECFSYKEKLGNIYEEITWKKEPLICQHKKCGCPLNKLDKRLFEKVWR